MHARGRPILGGFAGFFLGIGIGLLLLVLGVIALDSILLTLLPVLLLVLGVVWAFIAPLGRRTPKAARPPAA